MRNNVKTGIALALVMIVVLSLATRAAAQAPAPDPTAPQYQAKGEQDRTYTFPGTGESIAYHLYVPMKWDRNAKLPLVVATHGANQPATAPFEKGVDATWLPVAGGMHADAWAQPDIIRQIFDFFDKHTTRAK